MKTTLLFVLALAVGISASAQKMTKNQSNNADRNAKLEKVRVADKLPIQRFTNPTMRRLVKI